MPRRSVEEARDDLDKAAGLADQAGKWRNLRGGGALGTAHLRQAQSPPVGVHQGRAPRLDRVADSAPTAPVGSIASGSCPDVHEGREIIDNDYLAALAQVTHGCVRSASPRKVKDPLW